MIGFYALGGGFGHLSRVATFIQHQKIEPLFKVITNNPNANRFFSENEIIYLKKGEIESKEILKNTIYKTLKTHLFNAFYIDVFPTGILGELSAPIFYNTKTYLLARRLKWESYLPYLNEASPYFEKIFVFEPLEEPHQSFLKKQAREIISVKLEYPSSTNEQIRRKIERLNRPIWLVVHTSDQKELELLWQHAQDIALVEQIAPQWVILSDQKLSLPNTVWILENENPQEWVPYANKIFSAAGFNTVQQLMPFASKSVLLPFQRRFDDQFWRARRFKEM